jgi:prolyl 4-hydroxylase
MRTYIVGNATARNAYAKRAAEGRHVSRRLMKHSGITCMSQLGLELFTLRNFLAPAECADLIAFIDADCARPAVNTTTDDPDVRTAETRFFQNDHPLVPEIDARIIALLGLDPRKGEIWQGHRYNPGQHFKIHHDAYETDTWFWQHARPHGGQTTWTVTMYLNEPESGGETHFPDAAVSVKPETGMLAIWNNLDQNGDVNLAALHEGSPVHAGKKYIVNKFFREHFWSGNLKAASASPVPVAQPAPDFIPA